ncbi:hypothetical protein K9O30_02450 [Clostridium bowmanii]|nr:hypothetical protein [Clostridium bowmanii]MBU3188234.1 hypothetical protein [Clostridium bowmanii]MCA1072620.1 hypothetical protein [Clostridium bowmanii]
MGLNSSHIAEQLGGHSERTIRPAYNNTKGTSISERPAAVASRDEIGHW